MVLRVIHGKQGLRQFFDGAVLVIIEHPGVSSVHLVERFALETAIVRVSAASLVIGTNSPKSQKSRYVNELLKSIRKAIRQVERALKYIKKEVNSNDNKTP